MKSIKISISDELHNAAISFENFRIKCKEYLFNHNKGFDKFTIVSHDSYIGFITELLIKDFLLSEYNSFVTSVEAWEEDFDRARLDSIVESDSTIQTDIDYVASYFYDKWDLKINGSSGVIRADIKTALTKKEPNMSWNFLYPVVQANKACKDLIILAYLVVSDLNNLKTANNLVIIGATTTSIIKKCEIIYEGTVTKYGTTSQIDNYNTLIKEHYFPIEQFLKNNCTTK